MFVTDDAGQNHTEVFTLRVKMKFVLWVRDNIKSKAEFIWSAAGDHWTAAITASVGKKSPQRERERVNPLEKPHWLRWLLEKKKKRSPQANDEIRDSFKSQIVRLINNNSNGRDHDLWIPTTRLFHIHLYYHKHEKEKIPTTNNIKWCIENGQNAMQVA